MKPVKTKVSDKYQVVIPKIIRERAEVREGQTLYVYLGMGGTIVLSPKRKWPDDYVLELGEVWKGMDVAEYLGEERVSWR